MMPRRLLPIVLVAAHSAATAAAQDAPSPVDFTQHVKPVLESACVTCHHPEKDEGSVMMHTREAALASISDNDAPCLVPGKPDDSGMFWTTTLPPDDSLIMPPKDPPLDKSQTDRIKAWIEAGAEWPDGVVLEPVRRIYFEETIQPIMESNCVSCHKGDKPEGGWNIETREAAFTTGDNAPSIIPFDAENSAMYFLCALDPDDDDLMPPTKNDGPLPSEQIEFIRLWIAQGAIWPEGVALQQREKGDDGAPTYDTPELVEKIHAAIAENSKIQDEAAMEPYTETIPLTGIPFDMVPIPSGQFVMGSPESDPDAQDDEMPQRTVEIAPFWMGKTEVTWNEYEPFMVTPVDRYKNGARKTMPESPTLTDAVSQPTTPYMEMSFGMGQDGFPAISMTQHAANKYCQWLSAQTGHFYRLATEAEWEYAARAGTTTAYSFGDDPAMLEDYAWFYDNADEKYHQVATKKPNPWGLHDMHGNVVEWVLDQYLPNGYHADPNYDASGVPWVKPATLYPRVARGGSWDDDPDALRSAARVASNQGWKQTDPQLPKSIWYHTDAQWLGFRIVRPLVVPSPEEMAFYWNVGIPPKS
ncbi:hypothetical protein BH23VER1_BH23VER1_17410 [soil metagenome]